MNDYVIHTEGLCLSYKGKLALDHLSLRLPRGGVHAIVGANGAGKSTLFRVLLGFAAFDAGSAQVLGSDCRALTPAMRARIGFVNEEHTLPGWMRVAELAGMQRRLYPQWSEERYRQVLANFNVAERQKIAELSRGERAGVSLALALAQGPELLILDEPTLGLDVVAKRAVLDALLQTSLDDGATVVYCSHQMDEIERVADNLVILERGVLRHMSPPDEFCDKVALWIADFPFRQPEAAHLPGVLELRVIEGLTHLVVFDQGDDFGARLRLMGARSAQRMAVSLDRAVNGFLARGHAGSPSLSAAA
ncbi:ABC transporter ATP-binding protein [Massilia sp. ZL223]|uniref:ABC transporter ATP-binding protein n=1 Tax=Massilia sp. ZL223 TaxID=2824904 RepID=UPI001B815E6B|nr:ABC transporter ATP-binding protein [Massilia sp. ZL223]MBQ5963707.1 ABC transporter ATP-binding protein [Massilia sp. ZL223]